MNYKKQKSAAKRNKKGFIYKHMCNVVFILIILTGLWSIVLSCKTKRLMDDIMDLSNDIEQIRQEQIYLAEKLDEWQEEIQDYLN